MARRCPYCGSFVSEEATTCKRCGKTLAIAPSPAPQSPETASAKKKPDAGKTTRKPPARPSQKPLPARPGSPKKTKEHKVPKETASQGPPEEQALKPDFPALDLEQARKAYPHLAEALANYISAYKKVLRESEHHKETITDYREDHDRSKRFNLRKVCIGIFQIDKKGCKKGKETKETLVSIEFEEKEFAFVHTDAVFGCYIDLSQSSNPSAYTLERRDRYHISSTAGIGHLHPEEILRILASTLSWAKIPEEDLEYTSWGEDASSKKFMKSFQYELRTDACHSLGFVLFLIAFPLICIGWYQGKLSMSTSYFLAAAIYFTLPYLISFILLPWDECFPSEKGIIPKSPKPARP